MNVKVASPSFSVLRLQGMSAIVTSLNSYRHDFHLQFVIIIRREEHHQARPERVLKRREHRLQGENVRWQLMSTVPWFTASFSASQVLLRLQSLQHQYTDHDYRNTRNSFRISFYVAHIKQEYLDNSKKSLVAIHFKSALYSAREQAVTLMYRPAYLPSVRPHR